MNPAQPIKIAILAMGGEGGGVLADWIVDLGEHCGYIAQTTSVPGVAQRTGATIYYVELYPRRQAELDGGTPVLALMPLPGDVDVVLASELMECGRAVQRGLVTPDRTTLIASTHRVYSIAEKSALGDGRVDSDALIAHALAAAKRFVRFDMAEAAEQAGSVISAVLFGALAGTGVLPFSRAQFEATIARGGVGVAPSLKAFATAYGHAAGIDAVPVAAPASTAKGDTVAAPAASALDGTTDAPTASQAPAAPRDPRVRELLERAVSLAPREDRYRLMLADWLVRQRQFTRATSLLGPLVVGCAAFEINDADVSSEIPCLWKRLNKYVSRNRLKSGKKLHVNDSKDVYSPSTGLKELERSILTFALAAERKVERFDDFLACVCPDALADLAQHPWYAPPAAGEAYPFDQDAVSVNLFANGLRA